ncbi:neuromedin-S isoform X3 [Lacerta agilis]|uniref:neuromedin-S isoform X3 n=1 Tax=Lacerta agilis TaxID=80427 RepID=UPI0014192C9A|nr:neuromedin-S isoform X3 [Lacerta agilis]
MQKMCQRKPSLSRPLKMKRHAPPFPLIFVIYCVCTARFTSGFPQPFDDYLGESDIPKSKICHSVMDLCNSMFNSMQIDEENNQEIYKRSFPVHPLMSLAPKLSERRMKRFLDPVCTRFIHSILWHKYFILAFSFSFKKPLYWW